MSTQKCNNCNLFLDLTCFSFRKDAGSYRKVCKTCYNKKVREYKKKNKDIILEKQKEYYILNKDSLLEYRKYYYQNNKEHELSRNKMYNESHSKELSEYYKKYYKENRDKIRDYYKKYSEENSEKIKIKKAEYMKKRRGNDILFKLRTRVSVIVSSVLSKNGSSKNNKSILEYLPYSIEELKNHLEFQFENWMTWDNYGKYKKEEWDDEDSSTWTWQIDHIIPQSNLVYTSMDDENFKKCWSLENLRPYSSKQNLIKSNR